MAKINRNSPNHHGTFPVRVLQHNVIDEFERILRSSGDEMHINIVELGELAHGIRYFMYNTKVRETSWIRRELSVKEDGSFEERDYIHIYENFLQMIWSISYALLVSIDQHPVGSGLGRETSQYLDAINVFSTGVSLLFEYDLQRMKTLPNPEEYDKADQEYVETANGIMLYAATFILLHEAGHHHFGHTDKEASDDQSKVDEYAADDFAFDLLLGIRNNERRTAILGMLVVFICILLKDGNHGGSRHPKPIERLVKLIAKIDEAEESPLWLYIFVALYLWVVDYDKRWGLELKIPQLSLEESLYANYLRMLAYVEEVSIMKVAINEKGYLRYDDLL